jgi:hypothetical protein
VTLQEIEFTKFALIRRTDEEISNLQQQGNLEIMGKRNGICLFLLFSGFLHDYEIHGRENVLQQKGGRERVRSSCTRRSEGKPLTYLFTATNERCRSFCEHAVNFCSAAGDEMDGFGSGEGAIARPMQQPAALQRGIPLHLAAGMVCNVLVVQDSKPRVLRSFQCLYGVLPLVRSTWRRASKSRHLRHRAHIRQPVGYVDAVDCRVMRLNRAVVLVGGQPFVSGKPVEGRGLRLKEEGRVGRRVMQMRLLGPGLQNVEHLRVARGQVRSVASSFDGVSAIEVIPGEFLVKLHEIALHTLTQVLHVTAWP